MVHWSFLCLSSSWYSFHDGSQCWSSKIPQILSLINFKFDHKKLYSQLKVMNPARDLGPRLMAISVGWEADDVFMFKDARLVIYNI